MSSEDKDPIRVKLSSLESLIEKQEKDRIGEKLEGAIKKADRILEIVKASK